MNRFAADEIAPVIDLDALKARCLGNLELVDRVLAKFTGQVDADLDELDQAIHDRNPAKAAQLAHRIKGMCRQCRGTPTLRRCFAGRATGAGKLPGRASR